MDAEEIIRQIVSGNKAFKGTHKETYYEEISRSQHPYITLISCSDSRVPMNAILPDTVNRVFSIENIGNQVLSTEGSVDYGIYHLNTPVLMILGHSDCGAIKAYMRGFSEETYSIKRELDFIRPVLKTTGTDNDETFAKELSYNIERNIDYQVNIAFKKYRDIVHAGKLTIIGAYYDFTDDFDKGKGSVIFINVNKKKNIDEIREMTLFRNLPDDDISYFLGRI